ncbi:sodium-dependent transporter [Sporosalibacterium faouarense]|uniref:sodium-dependent transporter n=1 Tax=Sporosalibacterium faouarense TaxID=516123 RepID=UPI00141C7368|nr:sodium-dependent transporter [Sporosalibacterium faouarense]MTI49241.1 sodium-dependent transporter [Bacillota bacterium]
MNRDGFGSRLGILAAAAGSAIGLGNIWKFPYIAGENGGAAFILVYLICIFLIGMPVMLSELVIGRKGQSNAVGSFEKVKPNSPWKFTGVLGVGTAFIILSFYSTIAGWIFAYISRAITGKLTTINPGELEGFFGNLISGSFEPVLWQFIVIFITAFIVISGIKKGVEKYSKILMPVLLLLLIVLAIRSVTLEGAYAGLEFLFKPDFSSLSAKGVLEALGHAFFSLSLGMCTLLTYGSYVKKNEKLPSLTLQITLADTFIALLAGIVIFPAVFAYGLSPDSGPNLIFITLPTVFHSMPFGGFFEILFFILIGIAAITSTISLLEVPVAFFTEEFNLSRKKVTVLIAVIIFIIGVPSTLSYGVMKDMTIFGKNFFDLADFTASNILLPIGGLLISLFVGWVWGTRNAIREATNEGKIRFLLSGAYGFVTRFIVPIGILVILFYSTGIIKP